MVVLPGDSVVGRLARHPWAGGEPPLAFDAGGPLLAADDPRLAAALESALAAPPPAGRPEDLGATAGALRAWLDVRGRVRLGASAGALLRELLAEVVARHRGGVVLALAPLPQRPEGVAEAPPDEIEARVGGGGVAAVLFEPRPESEDDADRLRRLTRAARTAGVYLVADETRTAGRLHAASGARALGLAFDAVLVGAGVACGAAFGAVLEQEGEGVVLGGAPADALALVLARACADLLARQPVAGELAALGEDVRASFFAACARERIRGEWFGPGALGRLSLPAQEGVATAQLHAHMGAELERLGVAPSVWCVPHAYWRTQAGALRQAIDAALARMRTLLVEHDSYLSGGLPYVFPAGADAVRRRGLAIYRYPRARRTEVTVRGDRVRIAFPPGPLGDIVSSGFFLQSLFRGDFDLSAEYELLRWSAGPDTTCLGLFFQNQLSTGRYYAQRTTERAGSDGVRASFDGELGELRRVTGPRGVLRLVRAGTTVTAWHRDLEADGWVELGRTDRASADDAILGAKIWSKVDCAGLAAEVRLVELHATLAPLQLPELEARADPAVPVPDA